MRKALTPIALSLLVVVLVVFTTFGSHGLLHLREMNSELAVLETKNADLERQIAQLTHLVNEIKHSRYTLERKAREELGLSRPDEMVYIFSEKDSQK